ncbi:copper-binding protein [Amycolatopsis sp. K13G38]|uniref:Copper-binding protein n=1 Tax=Amycolatopsis acididurans TaxID=2724524 RepID=A0ABX1JE52_9PSEU|nr:copper-binding protein [Amycolatopsis acididurans]NKQ56975.1 copper-binding protein [Amycolatopsis acididurans]
MSIRRAARHGAHALAIGTAAVFAAACGGTTPSSPPTSAAAPAGTSVTATMTDYHIALSQTSFTPGKYTFNAVNSGKTPHALEINGPGVVNQRTPGTLQPGQSATLTVTLGTGSYELWCPIDGHKGLGMDLTVTTGGGPAPSSPSGY